MRCASCSTEAPDGDLFCENCGQRLGAAVEPAHDAAGCACGAAVGEVDAEGFCLLCGRRVVRPASDHMEQVFDANFAAVSDRGTRHQRNEDRFAVGQRDGARVLVVCDGVSASRQSELASEATANRICESLLTAVEGGETDAEKAMREAITAAAAALQADAGGQQEENPPSTTAVAALVVGDVATIGWVGDSRAYWIGDRGAEPLTRDHSWLNDAVDSGVMSYAEAERAPQAHAIVRWLGADAEDVAEPEIVQRTLGSQGVLLLCTDGLWNYASDPHVFLEVYHEAAKDADALTTGRRLVEYAIRQGGMDNVTVAMLQRVRVEGETERMTQDG